MKNLTRLGASLLGTWTGEIHLSTTNMGVGNVFGGGIGNDVVGGDGDDGPASLTAYFVAHFLPDPRREHSSCSLHGCEERNNHVCMMTTTTTTNNNEQGSVQKVCRNIAEEENVPWSDGKDMFCIVYV